MYTSLTATRRITEHILNSRYCQEIDENVEDLRALLLYLNGPPEYLFDSYSGQLWNKAHICSELRKDLSIAERGFIGAELYGTYKAIDWSRKDNLRKYDKSLQQAELETKDVISRISTSPANKKFLRGQLKAIQAARKALKVAPTAVPTTLGLLTAAGIGYGVHRGLKLRDAKKAIRIREEKDRARLKSVVRRKKIPEGSINQVRKALSKKKGFKIEWFISPAGRARSKDDIQLVYSL